MVFFSPSFFRFYIPFPKLFFLYHWMGGKGAHAWDALSLVAWTCTNSEKACTFIANYRRVQKVEVWTGAKRDYPEELCLSRAVRWKWWNLVFTFFRMRKLTCGSRRCFEGKSAPPQKIVAKTHHPENSVRRTVGKREPLFYGPSIPIPAKGNQEFTWKAGSAVEPAADPAIFGQGVDPNFGIVDPNFGVVFVFRFSNFTRPCYTPFSQAGTPFKNL